MDRGKSTSSFLGDDGRYESNERFAVYSSSFPAMTDEISTLLLHAMNSEMVEKY